MCLLRITSWGWIGGGGDVGKKKLPRGNVSAPAVGVFLNGGILLLVYF